MLDSLDAFYDGRASRDPRGRRRGRRAASARAEPSATRRPRRRTRPRSPRQRRPGARSRRPRAPPCAAAVGGRGGGAALLVLLLVFVWLLAHRPAASAATTTSRAAARARPRTPPGQARLVGQLALQPGREHQGTAQRARSGRDRPARRPAPADRAGPAAAQQGGPGLPGVALQQPTATPVDGRPGGRRKGAFQGAGQLPEGFEKYRFIDVSREHDPTATTATRGDSVLRGRLDQIQRGRGPRRPGRRRTAADHPAGARPALARRQQLAGVHDRPAGRGAPWRRAAPPAPAPPPRPPSRARGRAHGVVVGDRAARGHDRVAAPPAWRRATAPARRPAPGGR